MKTEFFRHIELDTEIEELKIIFEQNDIHYEVFSADVIIDKAIVGTPLFAKYTLKILPKDFKLANGLILELNSTKEIRIEDFEYLTELSNNELYSIIENPQEWSSESEIVARKILCKRGIEVSEDEIIEIRKKSKIKFENGKSVPLIIQFFYFLAIILRFYINIILILAGVGMGYYYAFGKNTDDNGEKFYVYDKKARKMGQFILYGGIFCFFVQLYLLFKIDLF